MVTILLTLLLCSLILFPAQSVLGACEGLSLCARSVIPGLFPYFLLLRLLVPRLPDISENRHFLGLKGESLKAYFLSFLGGYPSGISGVTVLYEEGKLTKSQAQRLLGLCNNSGPAFFLSVIGLGIFRDIRAGYALYFIHILSSFAVLALQNQEPDLSYKIRKVTKAPIPFSQQFYQALESACSAMLRVCGLVVNFSVLFSMLKMILPSWAFPLMGAIELCNGLSFSNSTAVSFVLCSIFMGWGGLCVHFQAMSLWESAKVKPINYWNNKLLHALLSGILSYGVAMGLLWIFPIVLIIICIYSVFCKKWGRKKPHHEL